VIVRYIIMRRCQTVGGKRYLRAIDNYTAAIRARVSSITSDFFSDRSDLIARRCVEIIRFSEEVGFGSMTKSFKNTYSLRFLQYTAACR